MRDDLLGKVIADAMRDYEATEILGTEIEHVEAQGVLLTKTTGTLFVKITLTVID